MKLSITDKFLWDIYNALYSTGKLLDSITTRRSFKFTSQTKGPQDFSRFIYYLKKRNYIRVENLKGKSAIMLTNQGLSKALQASFLLEKKLKRKDGKWIMVMFDIPQKHTRQRSLLRSILVNLGYKMFQQSVWVTPYDIIGETEKLIQIHSLDSYVKIFLIEKI
jgi:DNA-binding transcriptional regulator PaaX